LAEEELPVQVGDVDGIFGMPLADDIQGQSAGHTHINDMDVLES
jgi:hypothetical protein